MPMKNSLSLFCETANELMSEAAATYNANHAAGVMVNDDVNNILKSIDRPKSYIILSHIMDVYAQTVLSCMAYYEGWDSAFWNISRDERKYCDCPI